MMPSSTCIPLLFSSAAVRTPAFSLSPRSRHQRTLNPPLPQAVGEHQPSEGLGPPLRPHTRQDPSDTLWRQQPAQKECHCLASTDQPTRLLSKPGKLSRTLSQHSHLSWPTSSLQNQTRYCTRQWEPLLQGHASHQTTELSGHC